MKATATLISLMLTANVYSQQCEECRSILANSVFDVASITQEKAHFESYIKWLRKQRFSSKKQAKAAHMASGMKFVYEMVPFEGFLNASFTHDNTETSGEKLARLIKKEVGTYDLFKAEFRKANTELVRAWSTCMKDCFSMEGLNCWARNIER